MNFKEIREKLELTLNEVSTLAGYSISTISDFERTGEGSVRLREKLLQIYRLKDPSLFPDLPNVRGGMELNVGSSREIELLHRAERAEKELEDLKNTLRQLLGGSDPQKKKPAPAASGRDIKTVTDLLMQPNPRLSSRVQAAVDREVEAAIHKIHTARKNPSSPERE